MTKPRKQPAAATIAELIARWRVLEAEAEAVNASTASVKAKDDASSRAYKVIAQVSNTPAENMADVLLKLLFAAEVFNPSSDDNDVDAPPLASFILPVIEDAKRLTTAKCQVGKLARQMQTSVETYWRLEEERGLDHPWTKAAYSEMEAIEEAASWQLAESLEGAMLQIMLAFADVDCLTTHVTGIGSGCDAEAQKSAEWLDGRISRYLSSALAAIEAVSGVPREELGGEYYMSRELCPFLGEPKRLTGGAS